MNQEVLTEEKVLTDKASKAEKIRADLTIYNRIQVELARRYAKKEKSDASSGDWFYLYSQEFREAMIEIIGEEDDFIKTYQEEKDKVLNEIENRINLLHSLELKIIEHFEKKGNDFDFISWHRDYSGKFLEIIHAQPEILKQFESAEDKDPAVQEKILKEIEDRLYH